MRGENHAANLVERQPLGRQALERVDVHFVANLIHADAGQSRGVLDEIRGSKSIN